MRERMCDCSCTSILCCLGYKEEDVPRPRTSFQRRPTVFAESFDPEEEDDENDIEVFPKSKEERKKLAQAISNILIFRTLKGDQLEKVLDCMEKRRVKKGDLVIRQGDDGDFFYVIEKGTFNIYVRKSGDAENQLVGQLKDEGSFGELALMYNQPRAATVEAAADGAVWAMSRKTFRHIVLKSAYRRRKQYEQFLAKVEILASLTAYERMNLCDALTSIEYADGQVIFRESDKANGMYFVESGAARVVRNNEGKEYQLAVIEEGGYFGELALLTQKPRAATVVALGQCKVAFLDKFAFERLLGPCLDILRRNISHYKEKLKEIQKAESLTI